MSQSDVIRLIEAAPVIPPLDIRRVERWPLAPELRAVREAIEKLRGKPEVLPAKPYAPSSVLRRKRR